MKSPYPIAAFIAFFLLAIPPLAQATIPVPAEKSVTIEHIDLGIEQAKQAKTSLSQDLSSLEDEGEALQIQLAKATKRIQVEEKTLFQINQSIKANKAKRKKIEQDLHQQKRHIVDLITSLERLKKVPVIAFYAKPGAAQEAAQSALILKQLSQDLSRKVGKLKQDADTLAGLLETLDSDKKTQLSLLATLKKDKADIDKLIHRHQSLYERTAQNLEQKEKAILSLSNQSKSMKDLMTKLEEKEQRTSRFKPLEIFKKPFRGLGSSDIFLPVNGDVRVRFGDNDHLNAKSKGLWIYGNPESHVLSPMDGRVRFVGNFKSYGNLVIVEHKDGYHSLIAGLGEISAKIEQKILAGVPIGKTSEKDPAKIYYELRKSGKAIDPARKLGKLL